MSNDLKSMLAVAGLAIGLAVSSGAALAENTNLAPGFTQLAKAAKVVVMPVDVELFSMSAGGVNEPRADWTTAAHGHMKAALASKSKKLGFSAEPMSEGAADEFAEPIALHAAVARSIALHHSVGGVWALPTKEGKLDWSFGDAMKQLQATTGAQYGLFVWVRDSYATAERKLAMAGLALLGIGLAGGTQTGYASLVDLNSGQVMWFNRLARASGDLREAEAAAESIEALLAGFPKVQ
ncbi:MULTISPECIES: hypothetical protein [Roseateles]|uniref:Uncharacterized protein n=1 Tax=Roseateles albus TaxID=2987525 RepID=A0ABT5K9G6_9BURK|nr:MULTISPECIES: hypothetical protein [Roseateles]MCV2357484.1 hypothetical protein [Paucibacter sp. TC2R-5]MDC8770553.1 hypothetical protein [Roseateles albus]